MVTLAQKIGAKLALLMPKGAQLFEIQAHVYNEYGFCVGWIDNIQTGLYQGANIEESQMEEILALLYLLQANESDHCVWTQCHITIDRKKHVTFHFANVPSSFFYQQMYVGNEDIDNTSVDDVLNSVMQYGEQVSMLEFDYSVEMLFELALDYATGRNGIDCHRGYAHEYFRRLTQHDTLSLPAYYNWATLSMKVPSDCYWHSLEIDILELLHRARQSDASALFVLGLMYQSGFKDLKPNIKQSVYYYQQSALMGLMPAQLRVADLCMSRVNSEHK